MMNSSGILASEEAEIMLNMLKSRETDIDLSAEKETEGGVSWGFRLEFVSTSVSRVHICSHHSQSADLTWLTTFLVLLVNHMII